MQFYTLSGWNLKRPCGALCQQLSCKLLMYVVAALCGALLHLRKAMKLSMAFVRVTTRRWRAGIVAQGQVKCKASLLGCIDASALS